MCFTCTACIYIEQVNYGYRYVERYVERYADKRKGGKEQRVGSPMNNFKNPGVPLVYIFNHHQIDYSKCTAIYVYKKSKVS